MFFMSPVPTFSPLPTGRYFTYGHSQAATTDGHPYNGDGCHCSEAGIDAMVTKVAQLVTGFSGDFVMTDSCIRARGNQFQARSPGPEARGKKGRAFCRPSVQVRPVGWCSADLAMTSPSRTRPWQRTPSSRWAPKSPCNMWSFAMPGPSRTRPWRRAPSSRVARSSLWSFAMPGPSRTRTWQRAPSPRWVRKSPCSLGSSVTTAGIPAVLRTRASQIWTCCLTATPISDSLSHGHGWAFTSCDD